MPEPYRHAMDQAAVLRLNRHWRTAVIALRVAYVGLVLVAIGLILAIAESAPWLLAAGMITWLSAAVVTAVEFMRGRYELPEPRPGFWSIRFMLLRESINFRPDRTP